MAATKSQGRSFTLFIVGATVTAAGLAYYSSGSGKLTFVVGLVLLAVSFVLFLKIKPMEGKVAAGPQSAITKLIGVAVTLLGWLTVLFGIHATSSVGGRMTTSIVGLAVSLIGVLFVLPAAANKKAIWKA